MSFYDNHLVSIILFVIITISNISMLFCKYLYYGDTLLLGGGIEFDWFSEINSLSPEKCGCDFKCVNYKHNLGIDILSIEINITLKWKTKDLVEGKPTFVQVMAWCHYLSQCWTKSMLTYDTTKSQWINFACSNEIGGDKCSNNHAWWCPGSCCIASYNGMSPAHQSPKSVGYVTPAAITGSTILLPHLYS